MGHVFTLEDVEFSSWEGLYGVLGRWEAYILETWPLGAVMLLEDIPGSEWVKLSLAWGPTMLGSGLASAIRTSGPGVAWAIRIPGPGVAWAIRTSGIARFVTRSGDTSYIRGDLVKKRCCCQYRYERQWVSSVPPCVGRYRPVPVRYVTLRTWNCDDTDGLLALLRPRSACRRPPKW